MLYLWQDMNILLIWPKFPNTFWSFKYALPFISKKTAFPPLGLATIASFLPKEWEKKLIDLNVETLKEEDVKWADFIFISAMIVQKESVKELIGAAKKSNKKIIAGGPLFTTGYEEFTEDIDHFVLGEAEDIMPALLKDIENNSIKKIYKSDLWPDISKTPLPSWELIKLKKYASIPIQYSRGCPFNCEFCDIILLNGRVPRTKGENQLLGELEYLYEQKWREGVFFTDDNFIGNKEKLKEEILPAIIKWQKSKKYPFTFITQSSINLADDEELMELMTEAGFKTVFIGIETIEEKSLAECGKYQNLNRNLLDSIKIIQNHGLQVQGGFILGFDHDALQIFEKVINFIQKSRIAVAMVGLLQAPPKTRLWQRLKTENRLLGKSTGNNTDFTLNFIPKMNYQSLISGYKGVIEAIYSPKQYFQRLKSFLKEYRPKKVKKQELSFGQFLAFLRSVWVLGIKEKERVYFWRLLFWCVFRRPKLFPVAVELAISGFHFRKVSEKYKGKI